jgi:hypothetical protein
MRLLWSDLQGLTGGWSQLCDSARQESLESFSHKFTFLMTSLAVAEAPRLGHFTHSQKHESSHFKSLFVEGPGLMKGTLAT